MVQIEQSRRLLPDRPQYSFKRYCFLDGIPCIMINVCPRSHLGTTKNLILEHHLLLFKYLIVDPFSREHSIIIGMLYLHHLSNQVSSFHNSGVGIATSKNKFYFFRLVFD